MPSQSAQTSDRLAARILWGMVAGLALGIILRMIVIRHPALDTAANWLAREAFDPLGQVFLGLLFFVVVPLVFASLTLGIIQLGRLSRLGPLAGRTFLLFVANMAVGIAIGLIIMNVVRPGDRLAPSTKTQLIENTRSEAEDVQTRAATQPRLGPAQLVETFMPRNLLKAIVEFQILPLILFALLTGAAGTQLPEAHRCRVQGGLEIVAALMTRLVDYAMRLAPYAVAALMASLVLRLGLELLRPLLIFVLCVVGGIALHLFGTMSLLLKIFTRRSPIEFFAAIRTILVTAFSTSSSNATLPTSIKVARERLGVSASTAGFVLPLGATLNMSGTALYEGCVVLFIAQVYDVPLTLSGQIMLLILAVLSAVAVAGIPGASLPLIIALLANFQIPPEGIGLILGIDRLLDMARTVLNVAADVVTACIVDQQVRPAIERPGSA
ncbi:MAG TPA: dicarboxylate/amino acid:cation symporter [Verrucomicrobiota bacterium]|nr:dicarboxylate/amino acid:cation symporter [Verrucomicrobiota bacterium]HRZ57690.1 dicarboxylate/amino acid:cation symporter [Candidatus Paceibacterota bacterium]